MRHMSLLCADVPAACQTVFAWNCGGGSEADQEPFGNIDIQAIDVPQPLVEQSDCLDGLELVLHPQSAIAQSATR